jgi:phage major head subunit gpT-like protein
MQIHQANLSLLFKNLRVIFDAAYQAGTPFYPQFTLRVPSATTQEVYKWLGAVPGMRELVGEIVINNLTSHGYTIVNKEFESTVGIKQADIEQDTYGIYSPMFAAMGESAAQFPDELVSGLLINGFSTKCYTGKNFFDLNHSRVKGDKGVFSNVSTAKLSVAAFEAARLALKSMRNAAGRPMNLGRKLILVVSPKNEALGRQILQADFVQQTATNTGGTPGTAIAAAAVSNVNKGTAELVVWPQLAAAEDAWFVLETGFVMRPLIWQVNLETKLVAANQPNDFNVITKHEFLYQAYGRFNAGYGLPEFAFGSDGSAN